MNAYHSTLSYHTQVRWFSNENIFSCFRTKRRTQVRCKTKKILSAFDGDRFYILSLPWFKVLDRLSKKMQGSGIKIIAQIDVIHKLLWQSWILGLNEQNNNFASFHGLAEITGGGFEQNWNITDHLRNLQDNSLFSRNNYFQNFDAANKKCLK